MQRKTAFNFRMTSQLRQRDLDFTQTDTEQAFLSACHVHRLETPRSYQLSTHNVFFSYTLMLKVSLGCAGVASKKKLEFHVGSCSFLRVSVCYPTTAQPHNCCYYHCLHLPTRTSTSANLFRHATEAEHTIRVRTPQITCRYDFHAQLCPIRGYRGRPGRAGSFAI